MDHRIIGNKLFLWLVSHFFLAVLDSVNCSWPCEKGTVCVRKCCEVNESWHVKDFTCIKSSHHSSNSSYPWSPEFYEVTKDGNCVFKMRNNYTGDKDIEYKVGLPGHCYLVKELNAIPSKNIPGELGIGRFRTLMNGTVLMNYKNGSWKPLPQETYCVDEIVENEVGKMPSRISVLLVCKQVYQPRGAKKPIPAQYIAILIIAAAILFLTAVVLILLWKKSTTYDKTVFFQITSLFSTIIFLAFAHSIARDPSDGLYGTWKCVVLGIGSHFFFLASFFWLFVINLEIWWKFKDFRIQDQRLRAKQAWKLALYTLIGYGSPAVVVTIGFILDLNFGLQNEEIDCSNIITPNYGMLNCYISKRAQGPYLYYVIGILLICNVIFFGWSTYKILSYQRSTQHVRSSRSSSGKPQQMTIFLRLFVVMGGAWVVEIATWIINPDVKGRVPLYWIVFDYISLLQAICVFLIFVCRKDVMEDLMELYPSLECVLRPLLRPFACCTSREPEQSSKPPSPSELKLQRSDNVKDSNGSVHLSLHDLNTTTISDTNEPKPITQ